MIEYLYNAIRATANEDISIAAKIVNDSGIAVDSNCYLVLFDKEDKELVRVEGTFVEEAWQFNIPAAATANITGRYWYCICSDTNKLQFKQPLYLV
jgi:hypothetical protein